MTGREIGLSDVRKAYKDRHAIYDEIEYWVHEKGWTVRAQGHKFALWPPNPGFRLIPPWVRIPGTPGGDPQNTARTIGRECRKIERLIAEHASE